MEVKFKVLTPSVVPIWLKKIMLLSNNKQPLRTQAKTKWKAERLLRNRSLIYLPLNICLNLAPIITVWVENCRIMSPPWVRVKIKHKCPRFKDLLHKPAITIPILSTVLGITSSNRILPIHLISRKLYKLKFQMKVTLNNWLMRPNWKVQGWNLKTILFILIFLKLSKFRMGLVPLIHQELINKRLILDRHSKINYRRSQLQFQFSSNFRWWPKCLYSQLIR